MLNRTQVATEITVGFCNRSIYDRSRKRLSIQESLRAVRWSAHSIFAALVFALFDLGFAAH